MRNYLRQIYSLTLSHCSISLHFCHMEGGKTAVTCWNESGLIDPFGLNFQFEF